MLGSSGAQHVQQSIQLDLVDSGSNCPLLLLIQAASVSIRTYLLQRCRLNFDMACLASSLKSLDLQHTATCLADAADFLAAVGHLTLLTELCCSNNQLAVLPPQWSSLKALQVCAVTPTPLCSVIRSCYGGIEPTLSRIMCTLYVCAVSACASCQLAHMWHEQQVV